MHTHTHSNTHTQTHKYTHTHTHIHIHTLQLTLTYLQPPSDHGLSTIYPLLDLTYNLNLSDRLPEDKKYSQHPLVSISDDCLIDDGSGVAISERKLLRDKCEHVSYSCI